MHPLLRSIVATIGGLALAGVSLTPALSAESPVDWPQWGQNQQHEGFVNVRGQKTSQIIAGLTYDPFASMEQAANFGALAVHYQAPLVEGNDLWMEVKTGAYTGDNSWGTQIWNEAGYEWQNGRLLRKWIFASDWKPEPQVFAEYSEPVFHAVMSRDQIYVPGFGGTLFRLGKSNGSLISRINPFGVIDPDIYVAGVPSADDAGNVYYNALKLGGLETVDSWLVKVSPSGRASKVRYSKLLGGAAPKTCLTEFSPQDLPWPPSADAVPPSRACGQERPGLNIAPAVAPDGTVYTLSRANLEFRMAGSYYSFLIAVNPDLTPKWVASLRGRLNDGCDVLLPQSGTPGGCRLGSRKGVDPAQNTRPAGRVLDASSSSPTILPDGSIIYASYTRYNWYRGHLFKFSAYGQFLASYDFGWDDTLAVYQHNGRYSIIGKDNHYSAGSYCDDFVFCPPTPGGPYYMTQLGPNLNVEWRFQSTNTESCTRNPDGTISCVDDHPFGFEWCINGPAIDADGTVYANSEDGSIYAIAQGGNLRGALFLNSAISAAYTPLSIDQAGRIYAENDGHLLVIGSSGGI
jgi:outer membrane protein assembly factor BamB